MNDSDEFDLYLAIDKKGERVPVHTAIASFVCKFCKLRGVKVHLIHEAAQDPMCVVELNLHNLLRDNKEFDILSSEQVPPAVKCCILPAALCIQGRLVISGLSSVLRQLVFWADANADKEIANLLGPRQNCLKACAEVSPWTKFCEQTVPSMVAKVSLVSGDSNTMDVFLQLERHLMQRSVKKDIRHQKIISAKGKRSKLLIQEANRFDADDHDANSGDSESPFLEGELLQLTDLIIFFCFRLGFNYSARLLESIASLVRVNRWYRTVDCLESVREAFTALSHCNCVLLPDIENQLSSIQLADDGVKDVRSREIILQHWNSLVLPHNLHSEVKQKFRASQFAIECILEKMKKVDLSFIVEPFHSSEVRLPWSDYPDCVLPSTEIGGVPIERADRKLYQLENMVEAVMDVIRLQQKETTTIVDFCSGGGHLGILLAYLLPRCKLILVENKEQSLKRALARLKILQLRNVTVVQSNLSCFQTGFDIGVSLHACGVVTDLVINKCLQSDASFVVCPCCYGGVRENNLIRYPRCREFNEAGVSYADYLVLGHAADQTQSSIPKEAQGISCMAYIDHDRAQAAMERGYRVNVCRMNPPTCSPKNHMIIGFDKSLVDKLESLSEAKGVM